MKKFSEFKKEGWLFLSKVEAARAAEDSSFLFLPDLLWVELLQLCGCTKEVYLGSKSVV